MHQSQWCCEGACQSGCALYAGRCRFARTFGQDGKSARRCLGKPLGQPDVRRACGLGVGCRAVAWDCRKDDFAHNEACQAAEGDGFVREGK